MLDEFETLTGISRCELQDKNQHNKYKKYI